MDDEAFLRAFADDPDDEASRLVYADWLEERGDPRAEFLRVGERLRSTPLDEPDRPALGQRWTRLRRTFQSSSEREWLARVEPPSAFPWWAGGIIGRPARAGVGDFYRWMRGNHWEWVILAVLAPIERVAHALIDFRAGANPGDFLASGRWRRGVPLRRGRVGDRVSQLIPLVQLRGHPWTIAVYDTFNLRMATFHAAQDDAREISGRLGTIALEFSAEDTSGALGYQLAECGDLLEVAEWEGGPGRFASQRRPPPWARFPPDYPDELFRAGGLYIPAFYASERGRPGVAIDAPPASDVERADLVDLHQGFSRGTEPIATQPGPPEFRFVHRLGHDPQGDGDGDEDGDGFLDGRTWTDDDIPF